MQGPDHVVHEGALRRGGGWRASADRGRPGRRTGLGRWLAVAGSLGALLVTLLLPATSFGAPAAGSDEYVKYYVVAAAYEGRPETLPAIALRLLGSAERSSEIFDLNTGRVQPDGAKLTDPNQLHAGWQLVLPWDAFGAAIMYGELGAGQPLTGQSSGAPASSPAARSSRKPIDPSAAAVVPSGPAGGGTNNRCAPTAAASTGRSDWAQLRMAPARAWEQTRGKGQLVAVVDSGVDGAQPQLAGHVALGADIVTGGDRGDADCIGTGTAMAGIVAAQPGADGTTVGLAPDATVLPIRVNDTSPTTRPADAATAVEVAISAGATVVALGPTLDLTDSKIKKALAAARQHDVVVVVGATTGLGTVPAPPAGGASPAASGTGAGGSGGVAPVAGATTGRSDTDGVLHVGGIGPDGQLAAAYTPGTVEVVAPGVAVASLGVGATGTVVGSGTPYAVAFVAAQAALVRAAYPNLDAGQVAHRIEATADRMGSAAPDQQYGWGMINPGSAITADLTEEHHQASAPKPPDRTGTLGRDLAVFVTVLIAVLAAVLLRPVRRPARDAEQASAGVDDTGAEPAGAGKRTRPEHAGAGRRARAEQADAAEGAAAEPAAGGESTGLDWTEPAGRLDWTEPAELTWTEPAGPGGTEPTGRGKAEPTGPGGSEPTGQA